MKITPCGLVVTAEAALLALAIGVPAQAQQPTSAQASAIRQACRADYQANCAGVPSGGSAALQCLKENAARTSPACQRALAAVGGSAPAPAPQASAARPASAQPVTNTWPHTISTPQGSATVYQPQVISWPQLQTLNTRAVIGITPTGATDAALGTVDITFATNADLASRTVTLTDPRLTAMRFPMLDPSRAATVEERIKGALSSMRPRSVPLDMILLSLRNQNQKPPEIALKNEPPKIFVSARPASLLVFDGDPVLTPIAGTPLKFAVNTNWDVFDDTDTNTWYWLNNGTWLAAPDVKGPWLPVSKLPPAFSGLPNDPSFAQVKQQIPPRPAKSVPAVFVSTSPAEIIVTSGSPQFVAIPGTTLQYVSNTDAALFKDANNTFYFLVSGRWFSAPSLEGPWTFATPSLPADFARIPPNGPRGFVLVSVPGTPQAQEALIESQVPQQATLSKASAKVEVVYAGPPKFEPIPGTAMLYAVNTSFNVIQLNTTYYACYQGAWFVANAPSGGWVLATTVPPEIYTIPPSSPMYPCTYVRVYATTPETVTYGYTAGYTMGFVSAGVVVYGSGWYYPPYIYPAPIPIYYPYPYTYSGAVYYNSATGAWARGGAIYGPYGGVAKAGTAYNPATGAWAHGGAVYGPYGGAGAFSAYNPSTGGYAHGSAVWGPDGASANANWYNPRTGVSGSTNQNSNAYGRWGSSTFAGPNQTVHTQSQSNARGSTGSFTSSSGAEGAGARGAGGNSAGVVKTSGGDVYAGADGNVYKKTDSGWEKYDNGSWNSVDKPTSQKSSSSSQNLSGETQRFGGQSSTTEARQSNPAGSTGREGAQRSSAEGASRFGGEGGRSEGFGQLEQDREARTMGAQRQQHVGATRGGGGFAGRGGGGFRR